MMDKKFDYACAFENAMRETNMDFTVNRRTEDTSFAISLAKVNVKLTFTANRAEMQSTIADGLPTSEQPKYIKLANGFNNLLKMANAAVTPNGDMKASCSVILVGDEAQACRQVLDSLAVFSKEARVIRKKVLDMGLRDLEERKALEQAEVVPMDFFYDV